MENVIFKAFMDEMEKISGIIGPKSLILGTGTVLGALGLSQAQKLKRRYELGSMLEKQQQQSYGG